MVIAGRLIRTGKDGDITLAVVNSVKSILPQAEIIISTWNDADSAGLTVDQIIKAEPPGDDIDVIGKVSHVRKQIVAVQNALQKVTRPYVLKLRPDVLLTGMVMLEAYEAATQSKLLQHKVVLTDLFIPNPLKDPTLFHLSDTVMFGLTSDLLRIWSSWDVKQLDLQRKGSPLQIIGNYSGYTSFRLLPEQALTLAWLNKEGYGYSLKAINDGSYSMLNSWLEILNNNFIILPAQKAQLKFPDRFFNTKLKRNPLSARSLNQPLYQSQNLFYKTLRYSVYCLNKYLICWFSKNYWLSLAHVTVGALKAINLKAKGAKCKKP